MEVDLSKLFFVPFAKLGEAKFTQNALKVTYFGVDQIPGGFSNGDCIHPCNGRPGCQFQSTESDN